MLIVCSGIDDRQKKSFRDALSRSTGWDGSRPREHGAGASGRGSTALEEAGSRAAQDCV